MQSNSGWSHLTCHNLATGAFMVESWYREIFVGATRASHCLSLSMQEGLVQTYPCRASPPAGVHHFLLPPWDVGSPTPMQPPPFMPHGPLLSSFPAVPCIAAAWSKRRRKEVVWRRVMAHTYIGGKKIKGNLPHSRAGCESATRYWHLGREGHLDLYIGTSGDRRMYKEFSCSEKHGSGEVILRSSGSPNLTLFFEEWSGA